MQACELCQTEVIDCVHLMMEREYARRRATAPPVPIRYRNPALRHADDLKAAWRVDRRDLRTEAHDHNEPCICTQCYSTEELS